MGCASIDPSNWPDGIDANGKALTAPAPATAATGPGGSKSVGVPMGVVTVTNTKTVAVALAASSAAPKGADPGCSITQSLTFANLAAGASAVVALPFGTWQIKVDGANALSTALSIPPGATGTVIGTGGIVTLDPRMVVTP